MTPLDSIENIDFMSMPTYYMVRQEDGWRWVSNDGTRSGDRAFKYATGCMHHAERTLAQQRYLLPSWTPPR